MKHLDKKSLKKILSLVTESPEKGFQYLTELQKEVAEATTRVFAQMSGGHTLYDLQQQVAADKNADLEDLVVVLQKLLLLDKGGLFDSHGVITEAPLTVGDLADAYVPIEKAGQRVAAVVCNPREASDLRLGRGGAIRWEEEGASIRKGLQGNLWGALILVSKDIPPGRVWVLSDYECIFPSSGPTKTPLGFFNPKAITEIRVKRS